MEPKDFSYNNEEVVGVALTCDKCKGCIYAFEGKNGYQRGICQKYPKVKPIEVIKSEESCKFYKS